MSEIIYWFCLLIILYVYAGYPLLVALLGLVLHKPVRTDPAYTPTVSIIIAAYNEESVIREKLENCLALDYPDQNLELIVVSDGSSDNTSERVRQISGQFTNRRIRLMELLRSGKMQALNEGAKAATGDVLVLTDANAFAPENSLRELTCAFNDPSVGCVTAIKAPLKPGQQPVAQGEAGYWRYESVLKQMESRLGSCTGAEGAFFAIRRKLYPYLQDPAQADDMAISLRVALAGFRLVQSPGALVYEVAPEQAHTEFLRKARVTNHGLRALINLRERLWLSGWFSVALISHKLLRYLLPSLLILLLLSNILLVQQNAFYATTLILQLALLLLAGIGQLLPDSGRKTLPLIWMPYFFIRSNMAMLHGLISVLRGKRCTTWEPRHGLSRS